MKIENIAGEIRAALQNAELPFEINGIIFFGSRSTGRAAPDSDFDLLIVAVNINPKRHRRGEEILIVKRQLPPVPLDILLLSPAEVISNFKNHNPLFLDMAEDGVVLLDRNDFLRDLLEDTKKYIKDRNIKRLKSGWEFPVKYGAATYLSNVSNMDFSSAMLKDGERDYLIGIKLREAGFYDKAVYHFQQAIEKCVKSVLIAFGIFHKTHFVGEVLRDTLAARDIPQSWRERLLKTAEISESIEPDVSLSRYPGIKDDSLWLPSEEYEKGDAERAEEKAGNTLAAAKDFFKYWFE